MADIKQDLERLRNLYPDMSEEQLSEVLLGESAGIDFTSYAKSDIPADQMKKMREELLEKRTKNVTAFECRYFYGTIKYFEFFDSPRELLYSSLIEEKNGVSYKDIERWASSNGQLQGKMMKIYDTLTKDVTVCDIFETDSRLPEKYAEIVSKTTVTATPLALFINVCVNGTFDVYKAFGKGEYDKNYALSVTPDTSFSIRAKLSNADNSPFTLALNSPDFSIAFAAVPNRSATKSDADLTVIIKDKNALYYDNASKYFDPSILTQGLRS